MLQASFLKRMPFLTAAENRESFFARIALIYPPSDHRYQTIQRAYDAMKRDFREHFREDGTRYFEHLRAVCLILIEYLRVRDYRLIVAALLHDAVEDLPDWTIERVRREFGDYVAWLVEYMSKPSKKDYSEKTRRDHVYHSRFAAAPRELFLLKLPDRLHNLLTLDGCLPEKRERKIVETKQHYLPYAEQHLILLHELEEAVELAEAVPARKKATRRRAA